MTTGSCSHDARKYVIIEELRRAGTFDAILRTPGPAPAGSTPPSSKTKCTEESPRGGSRALGGEGKEEEEEDEKRV
jgi:hypothetical protein